LGIASIVDDFAVRVHDSVGGDGRVGGRALEGHVGGELAVDCAGEVDTVKASVNDLAITTQGI
jgi:hypothetical protein